MKNNHTDITFVLDRSGSMASVASDTIGGFNRCLDDQKKVPGTATATLNQFDDVFERVFGPDDIQKVKPLTNETFVPRNMTALLDAIGKSINDTGTRIAAMPEAERPSKVIIVILTDGLENASREFNKPRINEMISHQRKKYGWEFVFLGANQNAIATASAYGISGANAMTYASNKDGVNAAFNAVTSNMAKFRTGAVRTMAFSADQRKEQEGAGVFQEED